MKHQYPTILTVARRQGRMWRSRIIAGCSLLIALQDTFDDTAFEPVQYDPKPPLKPNTSSNIN